MCGKGCESEITLATQGNKTIGSRSARRLFNVRLLLMVAFLVFSSLGGVDVERRVGEDKEREGEKDTESKSYKEEWDRRREREKGVMRKK